MDRILELLPVQWTVADFLPRIPRETLGYDAEGGPIEDPNEPFESTSGLLFPWSETVDPE